jgi:hypothetical protein
MNWQQPLDSLQLDNNLALDNEIEAITAVQLDRLMEHGQRYLSAELQAALFSS